MWVIAYFQGPFQQCIRMAIKTFFKVSSPKSQDSAQILIETIIQFKVHIQTYPSFSTFKIFTLVKSWDLIIVIGLLARRERRYILRRERIGLPINWISENLFIILSKGFPLSFNKGHWCIQGSLHIYLYISWLPPFLVWCWHWGCFWLKIQSLNFYHWYNYSLSLISSLIHPLAAGGDGFFKNCPEVFWLSQFALSP